MNKQARLSRLALTSIASVALATPLSAGDFASQLDAKTEGYLSITDGQFSYEELKETKLWNFVEKQVKTDGANLDEVDQSPEAKMVMAVLGEEFFVAFGEGTGEQASRLYQTSGLMNYLQMKGMVQMMIQLMDDDLDGFGEGDQTLQQLLENPEKLFELIDGAEMPPILVGAKISDADMRGNLSEMVNQGVDMLIEELNENAEADVAVPLEFEASGLKMSGFEIKGETAAAAIPPEGVEEMTETLGKDNYDKVVDLVKKGRLVLGSAVKGDYLLIFLGSDSADLKFAADESASLAKSASYAFVDQFKSKKIATEFFFSKTLLDQMYAEVSSLGDMADGIRDGLKETDKLGDTKDLQALLDMTSDAEKEMYGRMEWSDFSGAGFFEQGLKFEYSGGSNYPNVDLGSASKFHSLISHPDNFLTATWSSDPNYSKLTKKYVNLIGETLYTAAQKFSQLDNESAQMLAQQFGMIEMFKPDLLSVWSALNDDLGDGLGGERALVFDLKGSMPSIPGVAKAVIKEGKAPRFSYLRPVENRAKVATSWTKINAAVESVLDKVGEMQGQPIPMQEPMSSDKDGLTSWFIPIPMLTSDTMPCVCVSDDLFSITTSQKLTRNLVAGLGEEKSEGGAYFSVNMEALKSAAESWVKLIEENGEEILGDADTAAEFNDNLPQVKELIEAVSELKEIKSHNWKDGDNVRGTLHFRTK